MCTPDIVSRYAADVVDGKVVTGKLVRLACERHLRDLETGHTRELKWNLETAMSACRFFHSLTHTTGPWGGSPFTIESWQQFRIGSVFGWKRWNEEATRWVRRFNTAYHEVARKNGKTTETAGLGLYLLADDCETGADVYSVARKLDHARITWERGAAMGEASVDLSNRIRVRRSAGAMEMPGAVSAWKMLSLNSKHQDGIRPHTLLVDDLQTDQTPSAWEDLQLALTARMQPLTWLTTTAGLKRVGICYEQRWYAVEVLEGRTLDDSVFAYIATIDEGDNWQDESCWVKANPNLGVSVGLQYLRKQAEQAKANLAMLPYFLIKHLNVWPQPVSRRQAS